MDPIRTLMKDVPINRLKEAFVNADKEREAAILKGDLEAAKEHQSAAQMFADAIRIKDREAEFDPADIGKGIASGLTQGTANVAGSIRAGQDIAGNLGNIVEGGLNRVVPGRRETQAVMPPAVTLPKAPSDQDILGAIPGAKALADFQPETTYGQWGKAGADLAPGAAVAGGANTLRGTVGSAFKLGVVPGVAGEVVTELTPDEFDPYVRAAANIVAGAGDTMVANWARGAIAHPTDAFVDLQLAANALIRRATKTQNPKDIAEAARLGTKAKLLSDITDIAKTKAAIGKKGELDKIREGFAQLDIRLTNSLPDDPLLLIWTPDERDLIKRLAQGAPTERAFRELAERSGDIRTLMEIGIGGGLVDAAFRSYLQGQPPDMRSALTGVALLSAGALTAAGARGAANSQTRGNLGALNETVLNKGKGVAPVTPGKLNPAVMGLYGSGLSQTMPVPSEMDARYAPPDEVLKGFLRAYPVWLDGTQYPNHNPYSAILGVRG